MKQRKWTKRIGLAAGLFGFILMIVPQAHALEEILKNYRGIRSLGMGGVVTTTGLYDESLFGNPATQLEDPNWKLSILSLTAEVNNHFISDLKKIREAQKESGNGAIAKLADSGIVGRNEHTRLTLIVPGFYSPHFFGENTSFAFGLLFNTQTNLMLRSNMDIETQAIVDAGLNFGVAHKFLDGDLNVGINAHLLYRLAADRALHVVDLLGGSKLSVSNIGGQGAGTDFDLGAYYKIPIEPPFFKKLSAGFSINNILESEYKMAAKELLKTVSGAPPRNDRSFNLGVRADFPDLFILTDTLLAVELQDIGTNRHLVSVMKRTHMGAETKLIGFLSVRAGINQGYLGGGLGFDLPVLKIDLATYGEELGSNTGQLEDRRYVARLSFDI